MHVTVKNTKIVGNSDLFDCDTDEYPYTYEFGPHKDRKWKERYRAYEGNFHHTGIVFPVFMSKWPKTTLPWHKPIKGAAGSNPALRGLMTLDRVTFDKFDNRCNGQRDLVIRTNPWQDDVNWPIEIKNIQILEVEESSKIFYNRPIAGKVNPADCTDFDCDGMKKALIWDDGSLTGSSGSIVPDSAYEWDGSPRLGCIFHLKDAHCALQEGSWLLPCSKDNGDRTERGQDSLC